jgi:hypothetical protein
MSLLHHGKILVKKKCQYGFNTVRGVQLILLSLKNMIFDTVLYDKTTRFDDASIMIISDFRIV